MKKQPDYQSMAAECIAHVVREGRDLSALPQTNNPQDAARVAAMAVVAQGKPGRENIGVISLNSRNRIVGVKVVSTGTVNQAQCYPRDIAAAALAVGAVGIVLFHNHPSGQALPSHEDIETTARLRDTMRPLDISVHDHLIIGGNTFYSVTAAQEFPIE